MAWSRCSCVRMWFNECIQVNSWFDRQLPISSQKCFDLHLSHSALIPPKKWKKTHYNIMYENGKKTNQIKMKFVGTLKKITTLNFCSPFFFFLADCVRLSLWNINYGYEKHSKCARVKVHDSKSSEYNGNFIHYFRMRHKWIHSSRSFSYIGIDLLR